jgi:Swt1-like HEPN
MDNIELFILKAGAANSHLRQALQDPDVAIVHSEIEHASDKLVAGHLEQVDASIRQNAERMAEFYKIFYILENDIRNLVEETLNDAVGDAWWDSAVPQAVSDSVKRNIERESDEGLIARSDREIDYTNFGELGEVIKANWNSFAGIFANTTINGVQRVIKKLNLARGPIAHCNLLSEDEVVRLKLTVRDWYKLMG